MFRKNLGIYFFLPIVIFIALNNIFGLDITPYLVLNPQTLLQTNNFWTLITFPLAEDSFIDFLFFGIVFLLYYTLLQSIYRKWFFFIFFALFTLLQGALFTLIFWNNNINFHGLSAISTFIVVVISLLYAKERFVFGRLPIIKVLHINLILVLAYLLYSTPVFFEGNYSEIVSFASPLVFGAVVGLLFCLQIYLYNTYFLPKQRIRSLNEIKQLLTQARESVQSLESSLVPQHSETEQAKIQPFGAKFEKISRTNKLSVSDDPAENEEILNKILDKISEKGMVSLTQNELEILKQISSKI